VVRAWGRKDFGILPSGGLFQAKSEFENNSIQFENLYVCQASGAASCEMPERVA
jgi:hypothetical protein